MKYLYTLVACVCHYNVSLGSNCEGAGSVELSWLVALPTDTLYMLPFLWDGEGLYFPLWKEQAVLNISWECGCTHAVEPRYSMVEGVCYDESAVLVALDVVRTLHVAAFGTLAPEHTLHLLVLVYNLQEEEGVRRRRRGVVGSDCSVLWLSW